MLVLVVEAIAAVVHLQVPALVQVQACEASYGPCHAACPCPFAQPFLYPLPLSSLFPLT